MVPEAFAVGTLTPVDSNPPDGFRANHPGAMPILFLP